MPVFHREQKKLWVEFGGILVQLLFDVSDGGRHPVDRSIVRNLYEHLKGVVAPIVLRILDPFPGCDILFPGNNIFGVMKGIVKRNIRIDTGDHKVILVGDPDRFADRIFLAKKGIGGRSGKHNGIDFPQAVPIALDDIQVQHFWGHVLHVVSRPRNARLSEL